MSIDTGSDGFSHNEAHYYYGAVYCGFFIPKCAIFLD